MTRFPSCQKMVPCERIFLFEKCKFLRHRPQEVMPKNCYHHDVKKMVPFFSPTPLRRACTHTCPPSHVHPHTVDIDSPRLSSFGKKARCDFGSLHSARPICSQYLSAVTWEKQVRTCVGEAKGDRTFLKSLIDLRMLSEENA